MALRPESSVSVEINAEGELVFACDRPGPVRHYTPDELGLPRVVRDMPASRSQPLYSLIDAQRTCAIETSRRRGLARMHAMLAQKARQPIVLPAPAHEEQPQILCCAEERAAQDDSQGKVEGEDAMPRGQFERPTNELKAKVLAEPDMPASELAKKTGASKSQIYNWRYEARAKSDGRKQGRAKRPATTRALKPVALQTIDVDPSRPGTADALIGALARQDAATATAVRIELTQGEVAALVGKLSAEQRAVFLAAGLRAALLA